MNKALNLPKTFSTSQFKPSKPFAPSTPKFTTSSTLKSLSHYNITQLTIPTKKSTNLISSKPTAKPITSFSYKQYSTKTSSTSSTSKQKDTVEDYVNMFQKIGNLNSHQLQESFNFIFASTERSLLLYQAALTLDQENLTKLANQLTKCKFPFPIPEGNNSAGLTHHQTRALLFIHFNRNKIPLPTQQKLQYLLFFIQSNNESPNWLG